MVIGPRAISLWSGSSLLWISRISKPSLRTIKFGDWVKLSDPKQALRGTPICLSFSLSMLLGIPGFLKPLVLTVFVLRSQELQILSFILGIRYPNLID
ncbi:hypothetical protein Tco_1473660 [Tanacetum coccineum]